MTSPNVFSHNILTLDCHFSSVAKAFDLLHFSTFKVQAGSMPIGDEAKKRVHSGGAGARSAGVHK